MDHGVDVSTSGQGRTADVLDAPPSPTREDQAAHAAEPAPERQVEARRDDRTFAGGEWRPYVAVTALTGLVVFFMLRLWRAVWNIPFYYTGDAIASASHVKTTLQWGWYEYQPDLGAPYGQRYHDYPFSDNGSLVLIKALSPFVRDWPTLFNVYYVLCFFLIAWAALWFLRRAGVSRVFSVVLAVLYAVAPYHFMRNENHYFLAAYFTAPLALGVVLDVMRGDPLWTARAGAPRRLTGWLTGRGAAYAVLLVVVGSTVAYYAVFAGVLLGAAALAALLRSRSWRRFAGAVVSGLVLVATMLLNLLPDLLYTRQNGANPAALVRPRGDAEVWSLKLSSLLMPSPGHPIASLAQARAWYDHNYPLPSEQPSLGAIGSLALVGLLALALWRVAQGSAQPAPQLGAGWDTRRDPTMGYLSFLVVVAFLFATTGGLATVLSFATDIIRGWNRMSIFMSALLLAAAGLFLMGVSDRVGRRLAGLGGPARPDRRDRPPGRWAARVVAPVLATVLLLVGVADQTVAGSVPSYSGVAASWNSDAAFVHGVEARLPAEAMVFQLPFIPFPETPPVNAASSQDVVSLSLHSTTLRWSGGGLKGRPQTDWPIAMAKETPSAAARDLAEMGFSGIVVDRYATTDRGKALEAAFAPIAGPAALSSPNGRYTLLSLKPQVAAVTATTTPQERKDFTDRVLLGRR